jgi:nicotinamidase-related amidase
MAQLQATPHPRTAVLVIDEQNVKPPPSPQVHVHQRQVLTRANDWGWPIVFVQLWDQSWPLGAPDLNWASNNAPHRPAFAANDQSFPTTSHVIGLLQSIVLQPILVTKITATAFGNWVLLRENGQINWVRLHLWLETHDIRQLIVMGQEVNYCVRKSVVKYEGLDLAEAQGATDYGFTVLSCDQIVWGINSGNEADWKTVLGVEFYSAL